MARQREQFIKCPFCDKVIAEAEYKDQSNLPIQMQLIGDTFIGYKYKKHKCKKSPKIF